jgi:hypothetical protein
MGTVGIIETTAAPAESALRASLRLAATALTRAAILAAFILIATGNITNSLLMKFGFEDQVQHASKHATFIEMMNGTAARPFVYRSAIARLDAAAAREIIKVRPAIAQSAEIEPQLHHVYFSDVKDADWTPVVAVAYSLMYILIVTSTSIGLFFVWKIAMFRGLSFVRATGFMVAFSFIFPLLFQRSVLFYDFIEFAGVFGACYFFLEDWMIPCTLWIAAFAFTKETFFLVPLGLFFLHRDGTSVTKRVGWAALQINLCLAARYFIMSGFDQNPGSMVEFHLWDSVAFWLSPKYWLDLNNLVGPGIWLPRLENPIFLIPIALIAYRAWKLSVPRWRRYFLGAFLPLLALYIPFAFGDMFRNFSLAFPAMTLIALSAARRMDAVIQVSSHLQEVSFINEKRWIPGRIRSNRPGSAEVVPILGPQKGR